MAITASAGNLPGDSDQDRERAAPPLADGAAPCTESPVEPPWPATTMRLERDVPTGVVEHEAEIHREAWR
ncbi:hypothetical protein [Streptomyces sp. NBC_00859]|uniref:hypothetical protein n=1 Tax=Streptomyces sp. NBC_00859 TaxID=2903682 RepID=UPI0038657F05|nr:hypothetical protein OG584_32870 [Streptomyces sp. NBC_00859]